MYSIGCRYIYNHIVLEDRAGLHYLSACHMTTAADEMLGKFLL